MLAAPAARKYWKANRYETVERGAWIGSEFSSIEKQSPHVARDGRAVFDTLVAYDDDDDFDDDFDDEFDEDFEEIPDNEFDEFEDYDEEDFETPEFADDGFDEVIDEPLDPDGFDDFDDLDADENTFDVDEGGKSPTPPAPPEKK